MDTEKGISLDQFKGNILTKKEKEYRLGELQKEIKEGNIDRELLPYLEKVNKFPSLMTTQSCCGHGGSSKDKRAHIDFRSSLGVEYTINSILKPLDAKFPSLSFSLYGLHCDRLRFEVWLDNERWREQLEYFITLLKKIERRKAIQMCKWGTNKEILVRISADASHNGRAGWRMAKVDACIAEELVFLNSKGVRTVASCCGHGKYYPKALILSSSGRKAKELGYFPIYFTSKHFDSGILELPLKGKKFGR